MVTKWASMVKMIVAESYRTWQERVKYYSSTQKWMKSFSRSPNEVNDLLCVSPNVTFKLVTKEPFGGLSNVFDDPDFDRRMVTKGSQ